MWGFSHVVADGVWQDDHTALALLQLFGDVDCCCHGRPRAASCDREEQVGFNSDVRKVWLHNFTQASAGTYRTAGLPLWSACETCWRTPHRLTCTRYRLPAENKDILHDVVTHQLNIRQWKERKRNSLICRAQSGWSRTRCPPPRTGSYRSC